MLDLLSAAIQQIIPKRSGLKWQTLLSHRFCSSGIQVQFTWLLCLSQAVIPVLARSAVIWRLEWGRICFHIYSRHCWQESVPPGLLGCWTEGLKSSRAVGHRPYSIPHHVSLSVYQFTIWQRTSPSKQRRRQERKCEPIRSHILL